jgi:hypothetical protein
MTRLPPIYTARPEAGTQKWWLVGPNDDPLRREPTAILAGHGAITDVPPPPPQKRKRK